VRRAARPCVVLIARLCVVLIARLCVVPPGSASYRPALLRVPSTGGPIEPATASEHGTIRSGDRRIERWIDAHDDSAGDDSAGDDPAGDDPARPGPADA